MILIEVNNQSRHQTLLELCLVAFISVLVFLSHIDLLIRVLIMLVVLFIWFVKFVFAKQDCITLQLTEASETPWVIIRNNEPPEYASLIQITNYPLLLNLSFRLQTNEVVSINLFKDTVAPQQWRKLHVLKRLTQKNNKFS